MPKIVINAKFGCYSLSRLAAERLRDAGHPLALAEFAEAEAEIAKGGKLASYHAPGGFMDGSWLIDVPRDDAALVAIVEELGSAANGSGAKLKVVEIPDGVSWEIEDYDGREHVAEVHRTWY